LPSPPCDSFPHITSDSSPEPHAEASSPHAEGPGHPAGKENSQMELKRERSTFKVSGHLWQPGPQGTKLPGAGLA
jgi:hypothetical protein